MVRGRKPDLPILKVLRGTAPPGTAAPALPAAGDVPAPPDWLDHRGVAEWTLQAPLLLASGCLPAHSTMLATMCGVHSWIRRALEADVAPRAALIAQYRGLCADLGLTGASRLQVTPAKPKNRFDRFKNNGHHPTEGTK